MGKAIQQNNAEILKLLLKKKEIDVNQTLIKKKMFFYEVFYNYFNKIFRKLFFNDILFVVIDKISNIFFF